MERRGNGLTPCCNHCASLTLRVGAANTGATPQNTQLYLVAVAGTATQHNSAHATNDSNSIESIFYLKLKTRHTTFRTKDLLSNEPRARIGSALVLPKVEAACRLHMRCVAGDEPQKTWRLSNRKGGHLITHQLQQTP